MCFKGKNDLAPRQSIIHERKGLLFEVVRKRDALVDLMGVCTCMENEEKI